MSPGRPNITLYTDSTPNGIKISIALEELGLVFLPGTFVICQESSTDRAGQPYKVEHIDISTNQQKEPWFLEINPNGRIPAVTDTFSDGEDIRLFESGSILQYLAEQYDRDHRISYPPGSREQYEVNNWVFFQNAGLGPMQGQANHFNRYAPEKIQYGIDRYLNETRRLYQVLDKHLESSKSGFLVGDHVSTADITTIGWVMWAGWTGVDLEDFPRLKAWEEMMSKRPGVDRGKDVPKKMKVKEMSKEEMNKELKATSDWVMKGMKDDANK
jgi:glutathione S-transferase